MSAVLATMESPAPKPVFAATESVFAKSMFKMFPITAIPIETSVVGGVEASVVGVGIIIGVTVPVAIRIGSVVGIVITIRISIRGGIKWRAELYTKSNGRIRRTSAHKSQNCCQ